ncbi:hypothetical protein M3Y98_00095300 [Aphelenchoides besseyi]|nr:hypothetical protein M3Y98_00095300 [Aphelenchoides besseyi]KAI6198555.1 hypothetical protein M3Y96_00531700 [Aphelenchoides besseyi]
MFFTLMLFLLLSISDAQPPTRPPSRLIDEHKDEFLAQCYQLGKINFENFDLRVKRSSFQHPKRPPPSGYVCHQNFKKLADDRCHPPLPRESNSQVWWLSGDSNNPSVELNATKMVENCCESISNQCDCFFRFGVSGTPSERICDAILSSEFQRNQLPSTSTWQTTTEEKDFRDS